MNIQVEMGTKNLKVYYILLIYTIIMIFFSLIMFLTYINETKNFVKVSARIDDLIKEIGEVDDVDGYHTSITKYVVYSYRYEGKTYGYKQEVLTFIGKKENQKKTIYINPLNPIKVRDSMKFYGTLCLLLFHVIVMVIITLYILKLKKRVIKLIYKF